ncbi:MAG TPA: hypothetical protein VG142_17635 [Trebonia sp.]|nr:hypothetical protein [Trebonia sp.]
MLTGLPLDCCGAEDGAWTLLELLLELLLLEEELELLPFDGLELPPVEPVPEDPVPEDPVPVEPVPVEPVLVEPVPVEPVLAAACVAPGRPTAITPTAAALLIPIVAVITFNL